MYTPSNIDMLYVDVVYLLYVDVVYYTSEASKVRPIVSNNHIIDRSEVKGMGILSDT